MQARPSTPPFSPVSPMILERYRRLVPLECGAGEWNRQERYGGAFVNEKRPLGDEHLQRMLAHGPWLACPARRDGTTDRVGFDLDCAGSFDRRRRDALYWSIRRLFGAHRVPLVYGTPSGHGLRVYYAIPRIALARLVTGRHTGLVADVLRAEAIPVRSGVLEIFPQSTQVDRLPLGRRMPLLDPETLEPIAGAAIGDVFNLEMLLGALDVMERWLAAPCVDLVGHLESLPRAARPLVVSPRRDEGLEEGFVRTATGLSPSRAIQRLVGEGLAGPHSRYHAEWRVGIAMLLEPALFAELGLTNAGDDEQVARTLTRWVDERNNGHSQEWAKMVRACRSLEAARRTWAERYLARGATTRAHMVDRLRRAVAALDGSLRRTFLVSEAERQGLVAIAEAKRLTNSRLFRAEVWLASYQRAVKSIIEYRDRRGLLAPERVRSGVRTVVVPIAARWMEGWQFGKGRYGEYRKLLLDAGRLRLAQFSPTVAAFRGGVRPPDDLAFEASEYEVWLPEMDLLVHDVGVDPRTLKRALEEVGPTMSGRPITLDTAHHILWLCRSGMPLRRRYGSRLGRTIEGIGAGLEGRMAAQGARIRELRRLDVRQVVTPPGRAAA